ncbi:MAG: hypothetical protein LBC90_08455 [Candidatus Adiutrix sp.]|jgi:hypothetical protein|nr:hypothetical protein [Candidatus Adiutrix sp.]
MRNLVLLLVIIASVGMAGCAGQSKLMQPVATINETVNPNEAGIVFLRYAAVGGFGTFSQIPIIEASPDGKLSFVGILSPNTKLYHRTTPGRHIYFLGNVGLNVITAPIMEANLEAGAIYYSSAFVIENYGLLPSGEFIPFNLNEADGLKTLKSQLSACRWVQNTPQGQDWFLANLPSLEEKYNKYQKTKQENRKVIKPEYGTKTPI